ncbi:MAG: alanine--glyoxylate aminotransferase family protein [Planctomycetota bacterium]
MKKGYLLTPGPTAVPPEVLLEMAQPIFHHRTPRYMELAQRVNEQLQYVFQTKCPVLTLAASGTGAMEASVVNTLAPGDKALVVKGGKFGERWGQICRAFGIETKEIDVEWGRAVEPGTIGRELARDPGIRAVFVTHCETSTATATDIEAVGAAVAKTDAIVVVDAISALGAMKCLTDVWKLDIVVTGSQKALMMPPGLAFLSVSDKAQDRIRATERPAYYFNLAKALAGYAQGDSPYTPAVTLVVGLAKALSMIAERGIERVWEESALQATACRAAAKRLGLEVFSKAPADSVTAITLPEGLDGNKLVKRMRDHYGVDVAGGQDQLKGKIVRIAHMGYVGTFDLVVAIAALEMALVDAGVPVALGQGVGAVQETLRGR